MINKIAEWDAYMHATRGGAWMLIELGAVIALGILGGAFFGLVVFN